jgi:hypothetical protein
MTDSEMLDWLEKANGLQIFQDGTEWTRPDGSKFVSRFLLSANGTLFAPYPTLRETIVHAMSED